MIVRDGTLVTASLSIQVWPVLAYGLELIVIMEASYNHTTLLRGRAADRPLLSASQLPDQRRNRYRDRRYERGRAVGSATDDAAILA